MNKHNLIGWLMIVLFITSCKKEKTTVVELRPVDADGNVYDTVRIGTQLWMKENLRTTKYNDGTTIPTNLTNADWQSNTTGACALYNNDTSYNRIYGKLYNWYAVNTGKLAPKGWHIPTEAEWRTLVDFISDSSNASDKMKSTNLWAAWPGITNTNSSGFTGLPAGFKTTMGDYINLTASTGYWSSTEKPFNYVFSLGLAYSYSNVDYYIGYKANGLSVRCIKD